MGSVAQVWAGKAIQSYEMGDDMPTDGGNKDEAPAAHCGDCKRLLHTETGQPWCTWSWADLQVDGDGKALRVTICKYKSERSSS